ncbi:L,D-transpeptidase [Roseivivax sediminis]|uniref:L,D-transpeptidase n=1 Tax=Roseivivax sediminis TaxID=936889 RepID=UPI001CB6CBA0|nr:L,D-transpeptidase [Roseivivax sediminis]
MTRRKLLLGAAGSVPGLIGLPAFGHQAPDFDSQIQPDGLPPDMQPQLVEIGFGLAPFEIHVDPGVFALYWTQPDGWAWRYPVGIGRPGLYEDGEFYVGAKKKWPSWTPTEDMIERDPEQYAQYSDGMDGGPGNPLGARALYLFQEGRGDTFLRIHGTDDPSTIGRRVSNGCARLTNAQILDLYDRVPEDTRVVLYPTL